MNKFERAELDHVLDKAFAFHGKPCGGTVIGVRMAMLGLKMIGITDPKGAQRKDVMAVAENDRCSVDAIQHVTGCRVSARALKLKDYGKVAATFVNLKTGKAVRIVCPEETRELVEKYKPAEGEKKERTIEGYKRIPLNELFYAQEVKVSFADDDMPGHAKVRLKCDGCGEWVSDHRERNVDGKLLCTHCAEGGYYDVVSERVAIPA
jgi:formylmethanofuran dehydrogenase subunit E